MDIYIYIYIYGWINDYETQSDSLPCIIGDATCLIAVIHIALLFECVCMSICVYMYVVRILLPFRTVLFIVTLIRIYDTDSYI